MVKNDRNPHVILFTGPSGCGKTTLARIWAKMMGIDPYDICEVNAANTKGIDMVREISSSMGMKALKSDKKIYIIDEAHQLTAPAQDSFLKPLEEPPPHVYFAICTTDPSKLKATIRTRCTDITVKSLSTEDMERVVMRVCKKEQIEIDDDILAMLIKVSEGSARKALVYLHQIREIEDTEEQMECMVKKDAEKVGIDLCRVLMNYKAKWPEVAAILKAMDQDAESVRRQVLGYASAVLLNSNNSRAALILESFETNLFDSGKPGLVLQAYNCFSTK